MGVEWAHEKAPRKPAAKKERTDQANSDLEVFYDVANVDKSEKPDTASIESSVDDKLTSEPQLATHQTERKIAKVILDDDWDYHAPQTSPHDEMLTRERISKDRWAKKRQESQR